MLSSCISGITHVVLLTWQDSTSVPDSEIISIARIIEENFSMNYTIELVEESNMKYLKNRPGWGFKKNTAVQKTPLVFFFKKNNKKKHHKKTPYYEKNTKKNTIF